MVGRKSVKVEPMPGVLRKVSSPPSSCASSRLMARPRPVPPYLRLVEASACWKASNTIFCFSTGMPTPVSVTSKATTELAWLSAVLSGRQPPFTGSTRSRTLPWAVNFSAFDSRFFRICCRRLESVTRLRARLASTCTSKRRPCDSAWWRNGRATVSSTLVKKISSASTVTVPDSILDRSRMSEIRFRRSVPAPWMVRANSTCLALRLPSGFSASCWPRIRIELSGVRSSWLMLARNSDL